jgi:hypothetical protein
MKEEENEKWMRKRKCRERGEGRGVEDVLEKGEEVESAKETRREEEREVEDEMKEKDKTKEQERKT